MNIIDELKWRGAVNQQTDEEGLYKLVGEKSISLYCGIDPTGDSMHIGHLIPFMILKRSSWRGIIRSSSSAVARAPSAIRPAVRRSVCSSRRSRSSTMRNV